MAYEKCIAEIKKASGLDLSDAELEQLLTQVAARAQRLKAEGTAGSDGDLLNQAAVELTAEAKAAAAIEERNARLNLIKRVARREFYESAPGRTKGAGLALGLEAKLVGVNTPFAGSRLSVDAQRNALRRDYQVGLATDLDRAGLFESVRSGALDRDWARELFELSKGENGKPGITGNKQALQVAEVVHRYQRLAVDDLNRAGAWIGEYEGYISRTTHDPDRLRRAGFDSWAQDIVPKLSPRTFEGVEDRAKFLRGVYDALVDGVHFTQNGLQGFKDPAFKGPGNLAKRLSQGRVLHFRDADSWLDYHRSFGSGTLIENVLRSLDHSARASALMREFGSNPKAEFEADLQYLKETHRGDGSSVQAIKSAETGLNNRFAELDGTAHTPVNRLGAQIGAGWRAVQAMSKLGAVLISAIGDVPLKASELRYQGIGLLDGYTDGILSPLRGRGRGEKREIVDLLRAGGDGMVGNIAARFDGQDTTPGTLAKLANTFFRWTGITWWTDAQRAGAEMMMARELGRRTALDWKKLPDETRRLLTIFDIRERDWHLLRQVDHKQADGRVYLTPDAAMRVKEGGSDYKRGLALKLQALYADRGEYAVIQPGAREHAILRQGTRPGTALGEGLRLLGQFKAFPVSVITKAWGREIHGGNGGFGATAGIVHLMAASAVFGYLAMSLKDLAKGRTPRDPSDPKTWAAAFVQGGGAGIYGDFLFGEYNRFGRGFLATAFGPTASAIEDTVDLYNRAKRGDDTAAGALRLALSNTPFANLVYTRMGLDLLLIHQIQEALNPGYLRRMERRVQQENGQRFWLRPSEHIPHGGGGFPAALVPGSNLFKGGGASAAPVLR